MFEINESEIYLDDLKKHYMIFYDIIVTLVMLKIGFWFWKSDRFSVLAVGSVFSSEEKIILDKSRKMCYNIYRNAGLKIRFFELLPFRFSVISIWH